MKKRIILSIVIMLLSINTLEAKLNEIRKCDKDFQTVLNFNDRITTNGVLQLAKKKLELEEDTKTLAIEFKKLNSNIEYIRKNCVDDWRIVPVSLIYGTYNVYVSQLVTYDIYFGLHISFHAPYSGIISGAFPGKNYEEVQLLMNDFNK